MNSTVKQQFLDRQVEPPFPGIGSYLQNVSVIGLFEAQVEANPFRLAAVAGDERLSYGELNACANQLGHYLRSNGICQGDFIGICIDRCADMLVSLLACLKIGAVYVPLDPNFPRERLEFMAEDCGLAAVLLHTPTQHVFAMSTRKIIIDQVADDIAEQCEEDIGHYARPNSPAYILYTSGSTGKPKGVQVPHVGLVNLLLSMRKQPGIQNSDVLLAITTLSFDIAALELFLPLIEGACVVIASSAEAADPKRLAARAESSGATILQATPIQWRMLIEAGWRGAPNLKILCGGEPLRPPLAAALLECGELWNMYGPTETTIWSSISNIVSASDPITVGKPIDNTFFYIVDESGNLLAPDSRGELLIGGVGVALGYLNRPELTAERFIPDRFQQDPEARMYRTGDLASWRADGTVVIFGRMDAQVKVRGFRIELGEIESVIARCPLVNENAVVVREDPTGEPALCAYFVPNARSVNANQEIRAFLRTALPDYMVPQFFIELDAMPQLPNGKSDRKSLPQPDFKQTALPAEEEDGFDELETTLIEIWKSVLKLPQIGRTANFFDLGGRSMLAARMFAQIERQTGKSLPLATLFQAPTVAQLATIIRDAGWTAPWESLVAIRPGGSQRPIFLVHAIGGNIVNFHPFIDRFDTDQPIYGLQARGLDGKDSPLFRVEEMADHYLNSIRSVQREGPYRLGGFSAGGIVAFEMARQLEQRGETVSLLALLDSQVRPDGEDSGSSGISLALRRWLRTAVFNLRYVTRTGAGPFAVYKLRNLRMRMRIRLKQITSALSRQDGELFTMSSLNAEEAFLLALRHYKPGKFGGKAVLFRARDELAKYPDPAFGWENLVQGGLDICEIAGDHDTLFDEPYIGELVEKLSTSLNAAGLRESPEAATLT